MSSATASTRYSAVAIVLHWTIAALILFMIWLGWNMEDNEVRFQLHKSIGIAILFLSIARVLWRRANPPPPLPDEMKPWEKSLSHAVHAGFYALMILLPLLGWFLVSTAKLHVPTVLFGTVGWPHLPFTEGLRGGALHEVAEFLHSKGAWVLIVLLAMHVGGAVKHEIGAEQGVFKRMVPGLGRTTPPRRVRGFLSTIGITALIFALIAGAPILLNDGGAPDLTPASPAPAAPGTPAAAPALVPNWAIDPETSEIRFSSSYSGKPFSGVFSRWTSDVRFDPEDLAGSAVRVRIDTGSASTGKRLYDDTLDGGEWFDTGTFATAKVNLLNFVSTGGDTYTAEASLLIKGQATNVPLTFTVKIKDDTATFTGETQLSRKALNLGQQSDPGSDWVADEVTVSIKGTATRIQ